ncbi:MAG: hypothetical protein ACRD9L_11395 [Bryobacteraceae bacterium]
MNSGGDNPGGAPDDDREAERPIRALIGQEFETSPDFITRIRKKIDRRTTVSHFTSYSWNVPKIVLTEMLSVLKYLFSALGAQRKEP